jgi:hypothetical protein
MFGVDARSFYSTKNLYILRMNIVIVATLALGSQPKQGLARVQDKREAREAHLIPPRVQESVKE